MRRKVNIALLLLILLIGLPYYWLLLDNRPGDAEPKPISLNQLRELAAQIPGRAPERAEVELVAYRVLPRNLFVAGGGMKNEMIGVMAWQLLVKGEDPIIIDSGLARADAVAMGFEHYYPARQAKVDAAIRAAAMVLTTHEHPDHQGNLVRLAGESVARKAWFNPGQLPPSPVALMLAWGNQPIPAARVPADGPMAVAPGVVVIPAPSHTPGSQMVYVRLASGQELLFAGDIASLEQNWRDLRARSRLIGDHFAPEDRRAVFSWLKTIQQLRRESPVLVVIPGHDWHTVQTNPAFKPAISIGFSQQPAG